MRGILSVASTARPLTPAAYQEVSVGSVAVGLTLASAQGCQLAVIRFEAGPVRYRVDGGVPSTTVGMVGNDTDEEVLSSLEAQNFQAIRTSVTNGTLHVTYLK